MGYIRDTNIHTKSSNIVIYNNWYKMYNIFIYFYIIYLYESYTVIRICEKGIVSNT